MSSATVFDQDAKDPDNVDVNDNTRVTRDDPIGWGYTCWDDLCPLNTQGSHFHGLSGYPTRALAIDAATQHIEAVRARRARRAVTA